MRLRNTQNFSSRSGSRQHVAVVAAIMLLVGQNTLSAQAPSVTPAPAHVQISQAPAQTTPPPPQTAVPSQSQAPVNNDLGNQLKVISNVANAAPDASLVETPEVRAKVDALIADVINPEVSINVDPRRSKLIRTKQPVTRFSVTNPDNLEVVQFSPTEFELIGTEEGETTLTLWFGEVDGQPQILRYLVHVARDEAVEERVDVAYGELQQRINEMFPNSMVQLIPIADKLIVRGQARDAAAATQILQLIRGEATDQSGNLLGGGVVSAGTAASPYPGANDIPSTQVISLLNVPGEMQVMLKVRIAELSRSALREMGADLIVNAGDFTFASLLGLGGAVSAVLDTDDVDLTLHAISSNSYSKILAEPNLVTLSGHPANFIAGGEFAVPTVVGVDGVGAVTTSFRGFGTELSFLPTVIDKDRIRLQVSPSFTALNDDVVVDGIPGLDARAVNTTVDLREGQWLAIAGLLQDQQAGNKTRVPFIGDIPVLDAFFSRKQVTRDETELIILVGPELVSPIDAEECPLILPGMEVTEPNDCQFFVGGYYEGIPGCDYRSTVNPQLQRRIHEARKKARGEAKQQSKYQECESCYVHGPHGFSR